MKIYFPRFRFVLETILGSWLLLVVMSFFRINTLIKNSLLFKYAVVIALGYLILESFANRKEIISLLAQKLRAYLIKSNLEQQRLVIFFKGRFRFLIWPLTLISVLTKTIRTALKPSVVKTTIIWLFLFGLVVNIYFLTPSLVREITTILLFLLAMAMLFFFKIQSLFFVASAAILFLLAMIGFLIDSSSYSVENLSVWTFLFLLLAILKSFLTKSKNVKV